MRVKHWPDEVSKCKADEFAKSNEATFIHWVKQCSPDAMHGGMSWCEEMHWMSLVNMTEVDLKESQ